MTVLNDNSALIAAFGANCDARIETSCAVVLLSGPKAYKFKKPVDFGFLDFSTREKRLWALSRELRFNRETAPDIYQAVSAYEGEPYLEMRRFDPDAVLDKVQLSDGEWLSLMPLLAEKIADFHYGTQRATDTVHKGNTAYVIGSNHANMVVFQKTLGLDKTERLRNESELALFGLKPLIDERFDQGFIARCHGDMHLGNILIEDGQPILFDCIDFNDRLSQIDRLYDLAFTLMDLDFRGKTVAANRLFNRWLEAILALEGREIEAIDGLALMPLYLSVRAGVRCHVSAHQGEIEASKSYLEKALFHLDQASPRLLAVGGLSGSGKSTFAQSFAPQQGLLTLILRSDVIRKRLWGAKETDILPPDAYTAEASQKVLDHMLSLSKAALMAKMTVVVDATFRDPLWRDAFEKLADMCGVAFEGQWLDLPDETRLARVAVRKNDASDITVSQAAKQVMQGTLSSRWLVTMLT